MDNHPKPMQHMQHEWTGSLPGGDPGDPVVTHLPYEPAILQSKRLLGKKEAATYCGISPSTFTKVCSVRPVILGRDNQSLRRFDIRDLDAWIDSRKIANENQPLANTAIIDRLLTP